MQMAAGPPVAEISNGTISATVYLPDPVNGFYQGTRFDWSGVVRSLEANGHIYYGPWFTKRSETVRDFIYDGEDIVAGLETFPETLLKLFKGENFGKLVLKVSG
mgnify:CR=1 FL=1